MISETFTLSLLTAVLLKVTLELVLLLKAAALARLRGATTRRAKATSALLLWVVAAGSKLVVLRLIDIAFGGSVSLGGFIPVTLLVIALLASRQVRRFSGPTVPSSHSWRSESRGFGRTGSTHIGTTAPSLFAA